MKKSCAVEASRPSGRSSLARPNVSCWKRRLRCVGGRLVTPGRGLFDLGWDLPFELDTSTTPKRISLRARGPNGPLRFNGIYLLDGTDLTLCLNENGEDPPFSAQFKTKKGS